MSYFIVLIIFCTKYVFKCSFIYHVLFWITFNSILSMMMLSYFCSMTLAFLKILSNSCGKENLKL